MGALENLGVCSSIGLDCPIPIPVKPHQHSRKRMNRMELKDLRESPIPRLKVLSEYSLVQQLPLWFIYDNSDARTGMRDRSFFPRALNLRI